MASLDYPDVLPLALLQGYGYKDREKFIRTVMDSGFARQRRRFTQGPTVFNVRFLYNQCELARFEQFFRNDLNEGIEFFNMRLSVGIDRDIELEVRFIETYRVRANDTKYTVSAKIETIEKPVLPVVTQEVQDLYDLFDPDGCPQAYNAYIIAFGDLVNIDYPASGMGA